MVRGVGNPDTGARVLAVLWQSLMRRSPRKPVTEGRQGRTRKRVTEERDQWAWAKSPPDSTIVDIMFASHGLAIFVFRRQWDQWEQAM